MTISNSQRREYPKTVTENFVVQELNDEILIYNLKTDKAFCLNPTSAFIWNKCDGQTSIKEIAERLSNKTNQNVAEEVVLLALDQLREENLILDKNPVSYFGNLTRREVIKRVGMASMIALPFVSSIVAPIAANAQSGAGNAGGACPSSCTTINSVCSCGAGSVVCDPSATVAATVGAGLCVDAAVAAAALGFTVSAGASGNVCVIATACVL